MASLDQYVIFTLDDQEYALPLMNVDRVIPAVYVTPLPKAPDIVDGIITIQGRVMPVINLRRRLRLPERPIELDDQFLIAHTPRRPVALSVDAVRGVMSISQHDTIERQDILPRMDYVSGVIQHDNNMLLIHDLEACLSLDEERTLDSALQAA